IWPDAGRARLEISPSTQILLNTSSSNTRARPLSWLTVRTSRSRPRREKGSLIMGGMIKAFDRQSLRYVVERRFCLLPESNVGAELAREGGKSFAGKLRSHTSPAPMSLAVFSGALEVFAEALDKLRHQRRRLLAAD